jgi:Holliday junction resolvase RusA-like endonuclease
MRIQFSVAGEASGKGSLISGVGKKTGRVYSHSPTKTIRWEERVAQEAQAVTKGMLSLMEGPLSVEIYFYLPKPKSARKYALPDKRPDLDKLIRAVLDGMSKIVYKDDGQVTDLSVSKRYGEKPMVDIAVSTLKEGVTG